MARNLDSGASIAQIMTEVRQPYVNNEMKFVWINNIQAVVFQIKQAKNMVMLNHDLLELLAPLPIKVRKIYLK